MAQLNQDLSKILKETGQFQAEYLKLPSSAKPNTCKLPDIVDVTIDLDPIDLPDITKICAPTFVEFPIIPEIFPPPESCENGIVFKPHEISVLGKPGGTELDVIPVSIKQDKVDFCDYDIVIPPIVIPCYPYGPNIKGSAKISVIDLNNQTSTTSSLSINKRPDADCIWDFVGDDITITIPEIPCEEGISFNPGIMEINSTCPIVPTTQHIVTITPTSEPCTFDIRMPEITIPCYPDGPRVHGDITIRVHDREDVTESTVGFRPTASCCDFRLGGTVDLNIPCQDGINFVPTDVIVRSSVDADPVSLPLTIEQAEDQCNFEVTFPELVIPCYPGGIIYDGQIQFHTIDNHVLEDKIDFNAIKDPNTPCKWNLEEVDIELPIPDCGGGITFSSSGLVIKANAATVIPAVSDTTGKKRWNNIVLQRNEGNNCGAELTGELNLGLPNFVTQCSALSLGPKNAMTVTYDLSKEPSTVIGLKTLDDGCGFEFLTTDFNIPALACGPSAPYQVKSSLDVYVGTRKLVGNENTVQIKPVHLDSPHCGIELLGQIKLPDITPSGGSFNYLSWNFFGNGEDEGYPQGTVASIVFPEGDRCAYRVVAEEAAAGVAPTSPDATGVWQSLGCSPDTKNFHPFKVIRTLRNNDQPGGDTFDHSYVKVVPRSYLYKDIKADSLVRIYGLETPFSVDENQNIYLECVFDAVGANITLKHAAIAVDEEWDDELDADVPSVYDGLIKTIRPADATKLMNTLYTDFGTLKYVGITEAERLEMRTAEDDILLRLSQLKDNRPRQLKAWILIAKATSGKVKGNDDPDEVADVLLRKADKQYSIEQKLRQHVLLVTKNEDNVPVVVLQPYEGNGDKFTEVDVPAISVVGQLNGSEEEVKISFTLSPQTDIFQKPASIGVNSSDIHIYYTTDGSYPTINIVENANCYLYEGEATFPAEIIDGGIMYMAISGQFKRSEIKSLEVS